jgi:hypothetical protein
MDGTEPVPSCGVDNAEPSGGGKLKKWKGFFWTELWASAETWC